MTGDRDSILNPRSGPACEAIYGRAVRPSFVASSSKLLGQASNSTTCPSLGVPMPSTKDADGWPTRNGNSFCPKPPYLIPSTYKLSVFRLA